MTIVDSVNVCWGYYVVIRFKILWEATVRIIGIVFQARERVVGQYKGNLIQVSKDASNEEYNR